MASLFHLGVDQDVSTMLVIGLFIGTRKHIPLDYSSPNPPEATFVRNNSIDYAEG